SPLVDARGWRLPRSAAHPSQLTDEALVGPDGEPVHLLLSTVLANGARWYVDHAHPEYSSPETTTPRDAMVWDAAGDLVAQAAAEHIGQAEGAPEVLVYKNNVDGKGQSYGAHENYLVARSLDFEELTAVLLPFFAARQVLVGAGRVGLGPAGERPGFQLSQRADYFEEPVGLETTIHRPIVNTRDEPHARPEAYRRLHVIIGDATLSQHATWLRMGMTALVLAMAEAGTAPRLTLDDPVAALQTISHDPGLRATVPLLERTADGPVRRHWTGLQILRSYLDAARAHCAAFGAA
ncbi:proteasome accessory factor PafA2, partial [Micrococcus sp. HSID17228]